MKLKKLFLGLVAAVATLGAAATTVNAAADGLKEDFDYSADGVGAVGGSNAYNIYGRSNAANEVLELVQVDGKDVLHFGNTTSGSKVNGTATDATYKLQIRDNASAGNLFNQTGKSVIIQTRYKTVRTYSKCFYMYSSEMGTLQVTNIKSLAANTWHDLTVVISEETTGDKVYAYADGTLIQTLSVASGKDWTGSLTEVGFQAGKASFAYEEGFYIDYVYISEYTPVTATVDATKTVAVGSNFELAPTFSGTAAIPNYTVEIVDDTKLTYSEGKFWGQAEGQTTVKFNFVDDLIPDVTTTVTVEAAAADIHVSDVSLHELFEDGLELTVGQSLPLDKLFTALPQSATNKTLTYTVTEGTDVLSAADGKLTATKAGSAKLTVTAADGGAYSEVFDVLVNAGNFASFNDYATTDSWLDPTAELTYTGWEATEYTGTYARVFTDITVVEDELFGKAVKYTGVGSSNSNEGTSTGGAALVKHVSAAELNANKDYKISGWAKVETTGDAVAPKTRVDVKVYAYKLVDGKPSYLAGAPYSAQMTSLSNFANAGWTYFEFGDVNFDTTKADGFKIELITWNCQNNTTAYVTNVAFVEQATVKNVGWGVTAGTDAITEDAIKLDLGSELQLVTTAVPSASTLPTLTFTSSDAAVVSVDVTGKITAVAPGTATVTVSDGTKNVVVSLNVVNEATKVELENATLDVKVGDYKELPLVVTPTNATSAFTAVSSDTLVATVAIENGKLSLMANAVGTATVVITSADNAEVTFTLTVNVAEATATELLLAADSATVVKGATTQITATVTPSGRTITYTSSNTNVATVDANGKVTAVAPGTATITVKADDLTKTFTVTVTSPATSVTVETSEVTLKVAGTHEIEVTVNPTDSTDTVTYKSSDASVATVDANGKVTAVAAGKAVITVTAGDKTTTVTVTVEASGCAGSIIGATTAITALAAVVYLAKKRRKED